MILKTVFTRTFKIPAELGDWKDPLNGRVGYITTAVLGIHNLPYRLRGVVERKPEESSKTDR
jgi:hypothetical protein